MSELNRDQIVKALEYCISEATGCIGCPYSYDEKNGDCVDLNMQYALSLIKQLTEENERLQEKADRHLDNLKAVLDERAEENVVDAKIATTKQDVARKIFEEIEKDSQYAIQFVENHKSYSEEVRQAKLECYKDILNYIVDLKKKYIGD